MNKSGFVMPTVLGFILIVSSIVLIQSISVVYQMLGLMANEQSAIELSVYQNVKDAIKNISFDNECSYQQEFEYNISNVKVKMMSNCVYTGLSDKIYNSELVELLSRENLTYDQISRIKELLSVYSSNQYNAKTVLIEGDSESIDTTFDDKYKIIIIESYINESNLNVLVINQNNQITKNVKNM